MLRPIVRLSGRLEQQAPLEPPTRDPGTFIPATGPAYQPPPAAPPVPQPAAQPSAAPVAAPVSAPAENPRGTAAQPAAPLAPPAFSTPGVPAAEAPTPSAPVFAEAPVADPLVPTPAPVAAAVPSPASDAPADVVPTPGHDAATANPGTAELADDYESVQASVVPVPMETFSRLVLAVDKLAVELTTVQRAIRDLTSILTDSLRSADHTPSTIARAVQDHRSDPTAVPQDGPHAPESDPTIFGLSPNRTETATPHSEDWQGASSSATDRTPVTPTSVPHHEPVPSAPPFETPVAFETGPPFETPSSFEPTGPDPAPPFARMPDGHAVPRIPSLDDVPLVSVGEVQVLLGPVSTLSELDDIDQRIRAVHGVNEVSVTAFEGREVLLTLDLARPIPLASVLRTELGRDVLSCRVIDGRIAVEFDEEHSAA